MSGQYLSETFVSTGISISMKLFSNLCTISCWLNGFQIFQPEFFGLRYVSQNGSPRWVELDRPLKRQLDKHALKYTLYLRIMYYVSGINLLTDEITR